MNFLIFNFFKERGIFNQHGFRRLLFLAVQIMGVVWLIKSNPIWVNEYLTLDLLLSEQTAITQLGQLTIYRLVSWWLTG
ncbi:MAG: hypothetical protein ABGX33_07850 [Cycloclasticus sp.]